MTHANQQWLKPARRGVLVALVPALLLCGCSRPAETGPEPAASATAFPVNQPLVDIDGVAHGSLANPAPAKLTSLFFVRTDCPVSNQYAPEIKRICAGYGPGGTQCLLVYADPFDTIDAVRRHRDEFGYSIPAILDPGHALVERAGATITPEAFVFAPGAQLAYGGRIDNLYNELGRPRQQVTEHDLRDALDDLAAGRTVRKPRTPATGCFIE